MKYTYLAATALAVVLGAQAGAQGTSTKDAPAEIPPASYTSTQYVDSRGCVYIRAGVDGNRTWIPRLSRQRRHVCGMEPTQLAAADGLPAASNRGVERITLDLPTDGAEVASAAAVLQARPVARTRAANPVVNAQPAPERVARATTTAAAPVQRPRTPRVGAPTPTIASDLAVTGSNVANPVRRQSAQSAQAASVRQGSASVGAPRPVATAVSPASLRAMTPEGPAPVTAEVRAACKGRAVVSSRYINSGQHIRIRCGDRAPMAAQQPVTQQPMAQQPMAQRPMATTARADVASPRRGFGLGALFQPSGNAAFGTPVPATALPGDTRVTPLHVYRNKAPRTGYPMPEGYRLAWEDDRLNPNRAEGTLDGWRSMDLRWTDTVPRRLINRADGRDVTAKVPLVYPFTDVGAQESQLGSVTLGTRNGQLVKRIMRLPGAPSARELQQNPQQVVASSVPRAGTAVLSTRSAAPQSVTAAPVRAQPNVVRATPQAATSQTATPQAAPVRQFVQVALFGEPGNAQRAAQQIANRGLPVRISKMQRNGRSFDIVMAGPFADAGAANAALDSVRRAGFGDAYLRR